MMNYALPQKCGKRIIVVIGIMIIIPYVPIIIKKGMLVIGKIVQYAGKILIPKCMSGTVRTNIILKNYRTLLHLNRSNVPNVEGSSISEKMVIHPKVCLVREDL